jgi:hypothetical protein
MRADVEERMAALSLKLTRLAEHEGKRERKKAELIKELNEVRYSSEIIVMYMMPYICI